MQIRAIDPIRAFDQGRDVILEPGDVLTVSDEFGQLACSKGWAEDPTGTVPTGERDTRPAEVSGQAVGSQQ